MDIQPLPNAGAEVFGVDITAVTVGDWNQLQAAFAAFGLLVFRDQIVTESEHSEFAQRWGEHAAVTSADPTEISPTGSWAADGSWQLEPPLGAVEVLRRSPGAPARFASTYAAFDELSRTTQSALEALFAQHSNSAKTAEHPIVIHHPISGRKTLFVNPTFTTSVVDMDDAAGLALLNQLYEHILLRSSSIGSQALSCSTTIEPFFASPITEQPIWTNGPTGLFSKEFHCARQCHSRSETPPLPSGQEPRWPVAS